MHHETPARMRALVLHSFDGGYRSLAMEERPVPQPAADQVLIRIAASPVNPSDLAYTQGNYPGPRQLPVVPGFEASGTVVAAGGDPAAQALVGRRVACLLTAAGGWGQYAVTEAARCMPLPDHLSDEQGATMLVNPLTALVLMEVAQQSGTGAVIQTAAASATGRMLLRLSHKRGLPMIHIVRRAEQAELLRGLGAEHVINSAEPQWQQALKGLARQLNARLAFDAVGGKLTGQVLEAMPSGSRMTVYGALALAPCRIAPADLIFRQKAVEGFWLTSWLARESRDARRFEADLAELVGRDLATQVHRKTALNGAVAAIGEYVAEMSRGKVLICPHLAG